MNKTKTARKTGIIGVILGSVALLLALLHFWAGPFAPQPSIETIVADKVASISAAAVDAIQGKERASEAWIKEWNADTYTDIATALMGGIAFICGLLTWINKEPARIAASAAVLGISAIAFQFIAMYAMRF